MKTKYVLIILKVLQAFGVAIQAASIFFLSFFMAIALGFSNGTFNVETKNFIAEVALCCFANLLFTSLLFLLDVDKDKTISFGRTKNTAKLAMIITTGSYFISVFFDLVFLLPILQSSGGSERLMVLNGWTVSLAFYIAPKILTPFVLLFIGIQQIKYAKTPSA